MSVRTLERSESSDDTPNAVRTLERSESSDDTPNAVRTLYPSASRAACSSEAA